MFNYYFFVCITICRASNVDLIISTPGDNSHYVEGESRYIWMTDEQEAHHLVDLQDNEPHVPKTFFSVDNIYLLFTRLKPFIPDVIRPADKTSLTNYNASKSLKVIVHGWTGNGISKVNILLKSAFLHDEDCNVIVVDWSEYSHLPYALAVLSVPYVGQHVGEFLLWLVKTTGTNWDKVHLAGHSLGAHVVGNAGRTTGNRPARITGMDPAGPLWYDNPNALRSSDAQYVESIHTDAGCYGIKTAIGPVDFYANGGYLQPGCFYNDSCSHARSYELFAASIYYNNLIGRKCKNIVEAVEVTCTGSKFEMGGNGLRKTGSGIYELITADKWPYTKNRSSIKWKNLH